MQQGSRFSYVCVVVAALVGLCGVGCKETPPGGFVSTNKGGADAAPAAGAPVSQPSAPAMGQPAMGQPSAGAPVGQPAMGQPAPGPKLPTPPTRLGKDPAPITPSGQLRAVMIEGLQLDAPAEWIEVPLKNPMRLAQMDIPGPGGFAELAVFRFPGGAGSVDQNIQRWVGQFASPDGQPLTPTTATIDLDGLSVTSVTLSGTYVAPISPRDPSQRYNEAGWAMSAVIVQGVGDPFFFKVVGPAATLAAWQPALEALMRSFKVAA